MKYVAKVGKVDAIKLQEIKKFNFRSYMENDDGFMTSSDYYNGSYRLMNSNGDIFLRGGDFLTILIDSKMKQIIYRADVDYDKRTCDISVYDYSLKLLNKYRNLDDFENRPQYLHGYTVFKQNGKYGIKDTKGKVILKPIYKALQNLSNGLFLVDCTLSYSHGHTGAVINKEGNYGYFINTKGRKLCDNIYGTTYGYSPSWSEITKDYIAFTD